MTDLEAILARARFALEQALGTTNAVQMEIRDAEALINIAEQFQAEPEP